MNKPKFQDNDKVLAKIRGYPAWPAKVEGVADFTPGKIKYHIYFYGTKQTAVCREEDVFSYVDNKELCKPKKYKGFNEAVKEIETELGFSQSDKQTLKNVNGLSDSEMSMQLEKNDNVNESNSSKQNQDIEIDVQGRLETNGNIDQHSDSKHNNLLSILKVESQLLDIEYNIQTCLCIKAADTDTCLSYLNKMMNLKITSLMLKKHPEILDLLVKLQVYVGNVSNWNMTEEEIEHFNGKASQIRIKAKEIYEKLQQLFVVPQDKAFMEFFQEELKEFHKYIEHMSPMEILRLVKDPTLSHQNSSREQSLT